MTKVKKTLKDLKSPDEKNIKDPDLPNYIDTKQIKTVEAKANLTFEEKNLAGQELAHKQKQLDQIRLDRKQRMASFKDQEQEVLSQISDLSNKVTLGYEYRKFRCGLHLDFKNKVRIYRDMETDVIIDTRAIEADDYQLRLPV